MTARSPNDRQDDALALALSALAATLADDGRALRFLDLTGIGTDELRRRAADPALLVALVGFLEAYEPDLIAVAEDLGVTPERLISARRALEA